MNQKITNQERLEIISEYFSSNVSYRQLGEKYKIDSSCICRWVMAYKKKNPRMERVLIEWVDSPPPQVQEEQIIPPPKEDSPKIKDLREALRQSELQNKLLRSMIEIAEKRFKIDIRKKSGTKQ